MLMWSEVLVASVCPAFGWLCWSWCFPRGGWLGDAVSGVACFFYMGLLDAGVWLTVAAVAVAGD
jgi:hypothetical protein